MRTPFSWLRSGLVLGALAFATAAQGDPEVTARLSSGVLRLGDSGSITISIQNAEDARVLELPNVAGLRFGRPGAPMSQRYSGFVNGRRYSESNLTLSVPFRPEAEGNFDVPPIALEVDGKHLETRALRVTVVKDITGADFGFFEIKPSGTKVVEGQPFALELTFGWDEERTGKVSFAELNLPWWDSLPGAIEVESPPVNEGRVTLPVNGNLEVAAEQLANQTRDGRGFITLRLVKRFLPTRSGTLEFPTSFFEFGRVRQAGIFETRRESHFVQAAAFTVEVVALPTEGQPIDYSGAVGKITARASADARDVRVGDSIKLTVEWVGQGNLEYFHPPDPGALDAFRGFRVYGSTEEKSVERRKVVYDLAPLSSEVDAIPALPLSLYDPERGRYETITTQPIPIRVRALAKESALGDEEQTFERDIADIDPRAPAHGKSAAPTQQDRFLLVALVGVPLIGLIARAQARRRAGDPGAPLERRRRRAQKELVRALERAAEPKSLELALHAFLAARTREDVPAWTGRDFEAWARQHAPALAPEVRARATQALRALEAGVWGGQAPPERAALRALAQELVEAGL
jgi:hypothetical protein